MHKNEVRLGNLVLINGRIEEIDLSWFLCCIPSDEGDDISEYTSSVPLTEEWLVKFGFDVEKYKSISCIYPPHHMFYDLEERDGYYYPYETDNVIQFELKYVHQLQNIYFALTGEELKQQDNGSK